MPKIKQVISTQLARPVRLPRNIGVQTAEDLGAGAFQELAAFGGTLALIAQNLQDTEDDLALTRMRGELNLGSADLQEKVRTEEPAVQSEMFRKGMIELANRIKASSERSPVQNAFQSVVNVTLPRDLIKVKAESLRQRRDRNIANLNEMTIQTAKAAALSFEEPAVRDILINDLFEVMDRMVDRGELSFKERGIRREALEEQVLLDEMQLLRRTNPVLLKERADAGFYDSVPRIEMLKILEASEADQARKIVRARTLRVEARFQENREFMKKLEEETLQLDEVLESKNLTRTDRVFYRNILKQIDPIKTQPGALLDIVTVLMAPTKSREQEIENAEKALQMAREGMTTKGTLSIAAGLSLINNASDIIEGADPEKDAYFKQSVRFLKRKFGWQGGDQLGQFIDPRGAELFDRLVIRLMDDVRREQLRGRQIFDRADEIAKAFAVNWVDGLIQGFAEPEEDPILKKLPSAITWRGQKQIIFPTEGRAFEINEARTEWKEIPVPVEE